MQTLISLLVAREYVDATCLVTLQQESSTFSIRENSNSLYIPYTCTFSDDGQKSYLTADSYNQNFQKLRTKKIGPAQSLSNSLTRQPFALTLRDGASLDYECNGCSAPFVIKLNCLDRILHQRLTKCYAKCSKRVGGAKNCKTKFTTVSGPRT